MRLREGIDDVDLKKRIRSLVPGDHVNVTFLAGAKSETWQVRITSIRGPMFRGKLARRTGDQAGSKLCPGASIVFRPRHIHSLAKVNNMDNARSSLTAAQLRQTDTNSLLRLADSVAAILRHSTLRIDRVRAEKAIERINTELSKRHEQKTQIPQKAVTHGDAHTQPTEIA